MTTSAGDMADDREKPSRSHESGRKSSKPLMEKRRRARINDCLTELQSILDALNPESGSTRQNKREKADILEQTVKLVKQLRQPGSRANPPDHHSQVQFRAGFNECMATVTHFLSTNQSSFNGDSKAGLLSHLASSLQCNKIYAERLPPVRRRAEEISNGAGPAIRPQNVQPTCSQSEPGISSMNVVRPMPATSTMPSIPSHSAVALPTGVANTLSGAIPVTARLELTSHGVNGGHATQLVPIGIPIKVQSPGQFILIPSHMFNGGQLTTPVIPVLSSPSGSIALGPSSAGSSGSAAMSPAIEQRPLAPPPKSSPQPQYTISSTPGHGAIMYASYPAAIGTPADASSSTKQAHTPYPVAFVAMGEPAESQNGAQLEHFVYPNLPGFYVPANPPIDEDPVWRPW